MSLPEGYRVVEVPESRKDEFVATDLMVWADISAADTLSAAPPPLDWGPRTAAVEAPDGSLAAVHASYEFTLPVPGATVPCAGLTWVGVLPDHRRRGLLSAMIATHFERSLGRGEPVSALFASEPAIYGRFGYGAAADDVSVTLPRSARLRPVAGSDELTVRFTTLDPAHADLVDDLHRTAGAGRPGWVSRDTEALRRRFVLDLPAWRDGAEQARLATVHAPDGTPRGYAILRRKEKWEDAGPRGVVRVREAVALDDAAAHRLWSFLLDLDLTATVEARMLAVDDRLLGLLVDRRAATPRLGDNVWVRVLDLPAALAGRRYAAPLDAVLEVSDDLLPANAGRWRVATVGRGPGSGQGREPGGTPGDGWAATVTRTDDEPDLRIGVRELGAAYLGGRSLAGLVRAGLVEEVRPGASLAVAAAFAWPLAPVCSWVF